MALSALVGAAPETWAQSSPADLADLSLEELMRVELSPRRQPDGIASQWGRWSLRYSYTRKSFDGFRDGTDRVPLDEVLFTPGEEERTDRNFPIVQESIIQEVHAAEIDFDATKKLHFSLIVPWVRQNTDHRSIVPGYDRFAIESTGIGDVALSGSYALLQSRIHSVRMSAGVSFPTGSIDKKGDTPKAPGDQQLPYTMQLGSGTWDVLTSLNYAGRARTATWVDDVSWGGYFHAKIRTGENDRNYTLGNVYTGAIWGRIHPLDWLEPSLKFQAQHWGRIDGRDEETVVPGPFPFPTPVLDPDLFGGERVTLLAGVRLGWPERFETEGSLTDYLRGQSIAVEAGPPIYQNLNGPQPEEDWSISVAWQWSF